MKTLDYIFKVNKNYTLLREQPLSQDRPSARLNRLFVPHEWLRNTDVRNRQRIFAFH